MNYILITIIFALVAINVYLFILYTRRKQAISAEDLYQKTQEIKRTFDKNFQQANQELEEDYTRKLELEKHKIQNQNEITLQSLKLENLAQIKEKEQKLQEEYTDLFHQIKQKERELNTQKETLNSLDENLQKEKQDLQANFQELQKNYQEKLSKISGISKDQALKILNKEVEEEVGADLLQWQQKKVEQVKEDTSALAREIVAMAVQRTSSAVANEFTVVSVKVDDEDKGKIIGKKGRNIQWLEKTLGVEFVIDETPGTIIISGFNSVRRHIAKRTLEKLLTDGRIHPSSIEEMCQKSKDELLEEIKQAGQETVENLGIFDFPPKLIRLIGRLKFRTSYGQNMLTHSTEMARLAKTLAEEMNSKFPHREPISVETCVKGALLHDIGKALDEETEPKGDHIKLGEKVCDVFGLDWRIKKCISSHHNESYKDEKHGVCLEAVIVDACDNISGGRLGARKDSAEGYYQRMEALEKIAENVRGVEKAWIMRGSRELWVFFDTKKVSPAKMSKLTRQIAKTIESNVTYPGEIKVVGLWEDSVVEYAK